tara:strand:+ start:1611 stop:2252 length:642 start_codon:yes stop_codon:yes gene_type:complete
MESTPNTTAVVNSQESEAPATYDFVSSMTGDNQRAYDELERQKSLEISRKSHSDAEILFNQRKQADADSLYGAVGGGYVFPKLGSWQPTVTPVGTTYNYEYLEGTGPNNPYTAQNYMGFDPLAYQLGTNPDTGEPMVQSMFDKVYEPKTYDPRLTPELDALMKSKDDSYGMGGMPHDLSGFVRPSLMSPSTGDGTYSRGRHRDILGLLGKSRR